MIMKSAYISQWPRVNPKIKIAIDAIPIPNCATSLLKKCVYAKMTVVFPCGLVL